MLNIVEFKGVIHMQFVLDKNNSSKLINEDYSIKKTLFTLVEVYTSIIYS